MSGRDPEKNFEALWKTFYKRYPFFDLRKVDWKKQYATFRPKVTKDTTDDELFDIFCQMLDPLNDGHVELEAKVHGKKRYFTPEKKPQILAGVHEAGDQTALQDDRQDSGRQWLRPA